MINSCSKSLGGPFPQKNQGQAQFVDYLTGGMLAERLFSKIKIQNLEEVAQSYIKVNSTHSLLQIFKRENHLLFSKAKKRSESGRSESGWKEQRRWRAKTNL